MRPEIEKAKEITIKAAKTARQYHEHLANARRTMRPELVIQETKETREALKVAMDQAADEAAAALKVLQDTFRDASLIRGKDFDKAILDAMSALQPEADEISAIAKRYADNETMLRAFRNYCLQHKVKGADIPIGISGRISALNMMSQDLDWCIRTAGVSDININRYADAQLQNFAENFETVFKNRLDIIGE